MSAVGTILSVVSSANWHTLGKALPRANVNLGTSSVSSSSPGSFTLVRMHCPRNLDAHLWSEILVDAGALYVTLADADRDTYREVPIFHAFKVGAPGSSPIETTHDLERWEQLLEARHLWSNSSMEVGFRCGLDVETTILKAASIVGAEPPRFEVEQIAPRDWVTEVQASWPPILISNCVQILFPWHQVDEYCTQAHVPILRLQPGLAFGTGEHPTTQLCCRALRQKIDNAIDPGAVHVLDYGSGSGVLSLAALKFGAVSAVGVEIDSAALAVSKLNAIDNELANAYAALSCEEEAAIEGQYSVVIANILAGTIIDLASLLASRVEPGGSLLLSGIWGKDQASAVCRAFDGFGFDDFFTEWKDGWALLSTKRLEV